MTVVTKNEENILSMIKSGNEIVSVDVTEKKIKIAFFDGTESNDLTFFINEEGNIETTLEPQL